MRWILTWKYKEDGSKKAKARAVLLGYLDPCYEHRSTTSPTTTKQTRQLQLQLAATFGFRMFKGDVTGAFLQSRPYPDDLFCIPTPEICQAMKIPKESITKVKKACYGLVDAPLEWYRSICLFFNVLVWKSVGPTLVAGSTRIKRGCKELFQLTLMTSCSLAVVTMRVGNPFWKPLRLSSNGGIGNRRSLFNVEYW